MSMWLRAGRRGGRGARIARGGSSEAEPTPQSGEQRSSRDAQGLPSTSSAFEEVGPSSAVHGGPARAANSAKTPASKRKRRALLPEVGPDGTLQEEAEQEAGPAARAKRRHHIILESESDAEDPAAEPAAPDSDATADSVPSHEDPQPSMHGPSSGWSIPINRAAPSQGTEAAGDELADGAYKAIPQASSQPFNVHTGRAGISQRKGPEEAREPGNDDGTGGGMMVDEDEGVDDDEDPFAAMLREVTGTGPARNTRQQSSVDVVSPEAGPGTAEGTDRQPVPAEPGQADAAPQAEQPPPAGPAHASAAAQSDRTGQACPGSATDMAEAAIQAPQKLTLRERLRLLRESGGSR